ncbi:MAG: hypothetical protein Q7K54_05565, partial [Candidatus Parcubacteria bacterium]|nr:hypothetical protein [Candidatus Parcubacteria bacterium]
MAKKIFDILPPKIAHKVEKEIKSFDVEEKKHTKVQANRKHHKEIKSDNLKRRFPLKGFLVVSGVLILILFSFLYFKLQKVSVEIWPKTEVLSFKEQLMADNSVETVNFDNKTIPAQYLKEEKDLWQEFPSTGSASNDGKAEGTVIIYNSYSPAEAVTLKSGTHFLS